MKKKNEEKKKKKIIINQSQNPRKIFSFSFASFFRFFFTLRIKIQKVKTQKRINADENAYKNADEVAKQQNRIFFAFSRFIKQKKKKKMKKMKKKMKKMKK